MSQVLLKLENVMHKYRWSHRCYRKVVLSKQKDSSQVFLDSLNISFWCGLILLKLNISWIRIWKKFPSYPKHFPNGKQAANNTQIHRNKSDFSIFFKKEIQNSLLSNTNDNGDNDENKNVYKDGWEYSGWEFSGWEFSGGTSPGENLMGGNFPGVNFPVGNFPDTIFIIRKWTKKVKMEIFHFRYGL